MKRIDDISLEALRASRDKWAICILTNKLDWNMCSICRELLPNNKGKCKDLCFLTISDWCNNDTVSSRLHPHYHTECAGDWMKEVNNFVWWMDLEIERIDEEELERLKLRW